MFSSATLPPVSPEYPDAAGVDERHDEVSPRPANTASMTPRSTCGVSGVNSMPRCITPSDLRAASEITGGVAETAAHYGTAPSAVSFASDFSERARPLTRAPRRGISRLPLSRYIRSHP